MFTDATAGPGIHWGIPAESTMRIWLVDLGDGRTMLVDFEADTQAEYDAWLEPAMTVVESIRLNR